MSEERNKIATIDRLFQDIQQYRSSEEFRKMIRFYIRFPYIGAYNAALVQQQRPGAEFVLTATRWKKDYNRKVKLDARPVVILIPFGPVEFLFDISDTEPIPDTRQKSNESIIEGICNQFRARSSQDVKEHLANLEYNLPIQGISLNKGLVVGSEKAAKIQVDLQTMVKIPLKEGSFQYHGYFNVAIKANEDPASAIAHIAHELGHLFCHHFKAPNKEWWKERPSLSQNEEEFEAETVSYLVCSRMNIQTQSVQYLTAYLDKNDNIPSISVERVLSAVDQIERMLRERMVVKKGLLYKNDSEFKEKYKLLNQQK